MLQEGGCAWVYDKCILQEGGCALVEDHCKGCRTLNNAPNPKCGDIRS